MTRARLIGSAVRRVEDPRLLTGAGPYIGDLAPTGMVHAVFTGADVNDKFAALPGASHIEGANNPKRTVLAEGTVRFVGEAVAVVVAESEAVARDAAERVDVSYDPLPFVVDLDEAAKD